MIVIIESPYAGDIEANLTYVRAAMRHSLQRGESPYASHALYTQPGVLDDSIADERSMGIAAGFAFRQHAALTAFYIDRGVSSGMLLAARHVREIGGDAVVRAIRYASRVEIANVAKALGLPMVERGTS